MLGGMLLFRYHYLNSALIIYICTIYLFYVKKHIKDKQNKRFAIFLWTAFATCVFDIISEEAIRYSDKFPIWSFYLIMYIYFILQNSLPLLAVLYELELFDRIKNLKIKGKIILYTPALIAAALIISNYWTNLVFYLDDSKRYNHGIGFYFLFIQAGYYLTLIAVYGFRYKKYIAKKIRYLCIVLSIIIMPIIILDLYLDSIRIQNLCVAVTLLLLFVVIQNKEDELQDSYGLHTNHALIKRTKLNIINGYRFKIILIKLKDKAIIKSILGTNYWYNICNQVALYFKSLTRIQTPYNLRDGLFAIMLRHDVATEEEERIINKIDLKFVSSKWNVLNTEFSLSIQMLELSYPNEIEEVQDLQYYINYYRANIISSNKVILNAADLNINLKQQLTKQKKILWDIIYSGEYDLRFMPVYSVSDNRIISREPLLKLPTDPPVYVSPSELDNETEDYRQLNKIHTEIFEDICAYIKNNPTNADNGEYMNVKVPLTQIMQRDFIEQYLSIITEYMIDYNRIGFELSEALVSYTQPILTQNIRRLYDKGVTFILDEFGTGYSSLEHLKDIPFKYVKLDKSIVKACLDSGKGLMVLNSIIIMMNQLKIEIIADGVDSKELANILINLGIKNLQGPYYL